MKCRFLLLPLAISLAAGSNAQMLKPLPAQPEGVPASVPAPSSLRCAAPSRFMPILAELTGVGARSIDSGLSRLD
mgnify:CR=1 FL=1